MSERTKAERKIIKKEKNSIKNPKEKHKIFVFPKRINERYF